MTLCDLSIEEFTVLSQMNEHINFVGLLYGE